jgi:hypothetical protein
VAVTAALAAVAGCGASLALPPDEPAGRGEPAPVLAAATLVAAAALAAAYGSPAGMLLAAATTLGLLVLAARTAEHGRRVAAACAAGLVVTGTGAAATLLLTLYLQDTLGYSPLEAGLVFACFGLAAVPGAAVARRVPPRHAVATGLGAQGAGLLIAVAAAASAPLLVAGVAGFGLGHVIGNASVAAVATAGAAAARHGTLVGMLITAQYLGGALGPSLLARASFQAGMALAGAIAVAAAAATWWGHATT